MTAEIAILKKGEHTYVFVFGLDKGSVRKVLHQISQFALDKDTNLTWYDAAVIISGIQERVRDFN